MDPNRLYTRDLKRNLYSTRIYTRNAIKNLIWATKGMKDVPLMWNNIPDNLIKSLPLSDELRNRFSINRKLWRRENSGVEEYSVGMFIEYGKEYTSTGQERTKQDTNIIKELQNVLITSNTLIPDSQYESVLLNMETFQGNRISQEFKFLYLSQILDFLNFNVPQSDIILWIEQSISYSTGYEDFITTVLHIVSEWFWWQNITNAPEWPGVTLLNHMGFRQCLDKGSDNAIIIGLERESFWNEEREDLILYMITGDHIPLYARYPLKLINNDDVPYIILSARFRERVSIEWLNQPHLPGRSLHGVRFWPVDIHQIWR